MKSDIKSEIDKSISRPYEKSTAKLQWDTIVRKKLAKSISQAIDLQPANAKFMIKARSAFYCAICDFKNHFYFKKKQKLVTIDYSTC